MHSRPIKTWKHWSDKLYECLQHVEINDAQNVKIPLEEGLQRWHDLTAEVRKKGGCVFLVGNGASASMSSHYAADLNKNARLRTQTFTDAALLTAVSNDISFDKVFAEPLSRNAVAGDLLLTISSSGNSRNILEAIVMARQKKLCIITLSGMDANNCSRALGNLNIYVAGKSYGEVETAHAALLHFWTDLLVSSISVYQQTI